MCLLQFSRMVVSAKVKLSERKWINPTNKIEKSLFTLNLPSGRMWMVLVAMDLLIICTGNEVDISNVTVEALTEPISEIYPRTVDVQDQDHTESSYINFTILNKNLTPSGIIYDSKILKSIFTGGKQNYHSLDLKAVSADKVFSSTLPNESTTSSFFDSSKVLLRGQSIQDEQLTDENEKTAGYTTDSTIHDTLFTSKDYYHPTQEIPASDSSSVENNEYSSEFGQVSQTIIYYQSETNDSVVEIASTPHMLQSSGDMNDMLTNQQEPPIQNRRKKLPGITKSFDSTETQYSHKSQNSTHINKREKTTPSFDYRSSNEVRWQINNASTTISTSTNITNEQTTEYFSLQEYIVQNSSTNNNKSNVRSKQNQNPSSQQGIFDSTAFDVATTKVDLGSNIHSNFTKIKKLSATNSSKEYHPKQFIFKHVSNLTKSQRNNSVVCIIFISNIDIVEWFHTYDTPFRNTTATFLSVVKERKQKIEPIDVIYIAPTPTKDEEYFCVSFVVRSSLSKNTYEPAENVGSVINANLVRFTDMLNHPIVAVKTGSRCNFRNMPKQQKWFIHCLSGSIVLVTITGIMATCLQKLRQHRRIEFESEPKIQVWGSKMHHRAGRYRSGPLFIANSPQMSVDLLEPTTSSALQPESQKETCKHNDADSAQIHAYENHFESEDTKL